MVQKRWLFYLKKSLGKPHLPDIFELLIAGVRLGIFATETNKYAKENINKSSLTKGARLKLDKFTTRE